jgi:predicted sugar kinase
MNNMKVTIEKGEKPTEKRTYPYVGKSEVTGITVLFTVEGGGLVLESGDSFNKVGFIYHEFVEDYFTPIKNAKIIIEV